MTKLTTLKFQAFAASTRFDTLNGQEHMVVPTAAVMAMVLNGILLPAKGILRFATAWNGVPVPVGHPVGPRGFPVSAKTSD